MASRLCLSAIHFCAVRELRLCHFLASLFRHNDFDEFFAGDFFHNFFLPNFTNIVSLALSFDSKPVTQALQTLFHDTFHALDPHLHTGSREPSALVASGITGSGVRG